MKTWEISVSTTRGRGSSGRYIHCGLVSAPTFDDALDLALKIANPKREKGELFDGGVCSLLQPTQILDTAEGGAT